MKRTRNDVKDVCRSDYQPKVHNCVEKELLVSSRTLRVWRRSNVADCVLSPGHRQLLTYSLRYLLSCTVLTPEIRTLYQLIFGGGNKKFRERRFRIWSTPNGPRLSTRHSESEPRLGRGVRYDVEARRRGKKVSQD